MALIRADALFKIFPAERVYKQKVKLRPVEHHYERDGEEPYIKYSCPTCEQISEKYNSFYFNAEDILGKENKFNSFSFAEGTERCPCCGVNIDWDYKVFV